uniref:PI3K/PI4K catalytic domain-containing protein n=1 Tax=Panagrolaimus davidi TaxID=227884 RepID=A0A914QIV9_9BILA
MQIFRKQCEHFSRYSLFCQAKKVIGNLPSAESFNALDGCVTICTVIKASMKQYQYQPTTVAYTNLKNELVSFLQADIKQFTPDCVALYASTRGQIFSFFKQISSVEENFRVSLKLLSTIDDINQAHTATKCYKMYSNYAFDRYMDTREPAKGLAAVVGLLKYISRECHTKPSRHILKLIYLVKRLSSSPSPPDLLKTFYALGPKCRMIYFLPYLHLLASEVSANSNEAFASLLILVAQVYPLHVLHAIYLQVGNEKFMKHVKNLQQLRTIKDENHRIGTDFEGAANLTEIHEYVYFNQKPDYATLSKMESANRSGFPFQTWLNRKQLKTANGIFASLIYIINRYVPADVSAFIKVINGLEEMDNHFIERYYRNWTYIWDLLTTNSRNDENDAIEKVSLLLPALFEELNKFLENCKNDGTKLMLLQSLKKEFPKLDGGIEEKLHKIADYFSMMENVIENVYSTIKLEELSQELYNFTGKLGRVISFSSFLEPHTGHCLPHIDLFVPVVKIYAKNGSFIKQLDVRLSNGKIVSYYIEPASIEQYFSSATNSFSSLNLSAEKFPDTNRRGALFRIPNIFQLNGIRLFEVSHCSLNKNQNILLGVKPLTFIMAESTNLHPFKSIANYYSSLSTRMSTEDDNIEHIQALAEQQKDLPSKALFNWFINRYEDDLGCVWYLRKSLSTQMALFSLAQYTFGLNQMSLENLYFDMSYGKLFNVNQSFSDQPPSTSDGVVVPFRLTPAFVEFFGLSINGHFIPTMVSLAQAFLRKRFEDYFRPFYWDFWCRACQKQGKKISLTEINEFDNRMNIFKQRLTEIANYNGDSDSTIFKLCSDSQSIEKRSVLPADLYPWF